MPIEFRGNETKGLFRTLGTPEVVGGTGSIHTLKLDRLNRILLINDLWETIFIKKLHGVYAHFIFFVLIPIANLVGRFYKEVPIRLCCNLQKWIIVSFKPEF